MFVTGAQPVIVASVVLWRRHVSTRQACASHDPLVRVTWKTLFAPGWCMCGTCPLERVRCTNWLLVRQRLCKCLKTSAVAKMVSMVMPVSATVSVVVNGHTRPESDCDGNSGAGGVGMMVVLCGAFHVGGCCGRGWLNCGGWRGLCDSAVAVP